MIANFVAHLQNHLNLKFNNQQTTEWVKSVNYLCRWKWWKWLPYECSKLRRKSSLISIRRKSSLIWKNMKKQKLNLPHSGKNHPEEFGIRHRGQLLHHIWWKTSHWNQRKYILPLQSCNFYDRNCNQVHSETTSGITTDRGCGAGGDILQYMQVEKNICRWWKIYAGDEKYMQVMENICRWLKIYAGDGKYMQLIENKCWWWKIYADDGKYMLVIKNLCRWCKIYVGDGNYTGDGKYMLERENIWGDVKHMQVMENICRW